MQTDQDEQQEGIDPADDQRLMEEFNEDKSDFPAWWEPIYRECKDHAAFTLEGQILNSSEIRNYKFTNSVQNNLLLAYVNHEANTTLTNKYHALVSPNGGGSNIAKARQREYVLRGMQRHASPVYNTARRNQLAAGIHYSMIEIDYQQQRGPAKTIVYKDVDDTWNCFPEPNPLTPTFRDIRKFLIMEKVPKALWKEKTGRDPEADGFGQGGDKELWQYWVKQEDKENEYLMNDGSTKLESELIPEGEEEPDLSETSMDVPFREHSKCTWKWYKIFEQTIIDREEWVGDKCPLVACTGSRVVDSQGKVHFQPLTQFAEDPQRTYTILANIILLRIRRSPYSRWMYPYNSITQKQLAELKKASIYNDGDVPYSNWDEQGRQLDKPTEVQPFVIDPILIQLMQDQIQQIERILGISDADLGRRTNEVSGVAIENRADQSNLANYHLTFNFLEYVKDLGACVLDLIPKVLTAPQQVAFLDKDDKAVMQMVNTPGGITFDPNEEYSLVVEVMPDSDTDREAEAENLMKMVDNQFMGPGIAQVPGGLSTVVKAQRGRYAQELGSMMEQYQNDPQKQQMQQAIQQLKEQLQQLGQQLTMKDLEIKNQATKHSIEASKELNRHMEHMATLTKDMTIDQASLWIDAFNADTARMKVDGQPQTPESLDPERAAHAEPDKTPENVGAA